jgi:hypothetical protein
MEEGREGSEKQAVAAKKLARSGSKSAGARNRATPVRGRGHGRRWSSSTDLDIEMAPAVTFTPTAGGARQELLRHSHGRGHRRRRCEAAAGSAGG